jgi:hypothetical protein
MTDYWEATAADYFDRVSSAYIIGAVTEACGKGRGRKAQRHEERQHGEGSRTVAEREGVATGSAAGRKVSQPVEPIARPWKIDPVSFARGHSWPHGDRLCAWRSGGQEYANAGSDRPRSKRPRPSSYCAQGHLDALGKSIRNMEAPMYQGLYGTGVTDGHRACKAIADKALALLDGKDGA